MNIKMQFLLLCISLVLFSFYKLSDAVLSSNYNSLYTDSEKEFNFMTNILNSMNKFPEPSAYEFKTSEFLLKNLKNLSIKTTSGWASSENKRGNGIVAQIGTGDSPCVAILAPIDAPELPQEYNIPFSPQYYKASHISGNDFNTAILMGAAKVLKQQEAKLNGTIKLILVPKHEIEEGSKQMLSEGVLTQYPKVDLLFGTQIDTQFSTGHIVANKENFFGYKQGYKIKIQGKGGHAGIQLTAIDPLPPLANLISTFAGFSTHELHFFPEKQGFITIGSIENPNSATNSVGHYATLTGTFRALDLDTFKNIEKRMREMATHVAKSYRCEAIFELVGPIIPALHNDEKAFNIFQNAANSASKPFLSSSPQLASSDFSYFYDSVPGVYYITGAGGEGYLPMYSHNFTADNKVLTEGTAFLTHLALEGLSYLERSGKLDSNNRDEL